MTDSDQTATPPPAAPTVSVIVPNYNHACFLPMRMDSIFAQTFRDFEVILLDDASTDGSQEVLSTWKNDSRVTQFVMNDTNSGIPCSQWQRGLELSRGELVWIAESDDVADSEFLATMVRLLQADDEAVLACCRTQQINADGQADANDYFWADALQPGRWNRSFTNSGSREIADYLSKRNTIPNASAVVFRRSAAQKIEVPTNVRYIGDWLFWMRLLKHGGISYCPQKLSCFRMHEGTTRTTLNRESERRRFVEYLLGLQEVQSGLQASLRSSDQDHSWIVTQYWDRMDRLPWWILQQSDLSLRLRLQFLFRTAERRLTDQLQSAFRRLRSPR